MLQRQIDKAIPFAIVGPAGTLSAPPQMASSYSAGSMSVGAERIAVNRPSSSETSRMSLRRRISPECHPAIPVRFRSKVRYSFTGQVCKNRAYSSRTANRKPSPGDTRCAGVNDTIRPCRAAPTPPRQASSPNESKGRGSESGSQSPSTAVALANTAGYHHSDQSTLGGQLLIQCRSLRHIAATYRSYQRQ